MRWQLRHRTPCGGAELDALGDLGHAVDHLVEAVLPDEQAGTRHAALAVVEEDHGRRWVKLSSMSELSWEDAGDVRQRTVTWQDPLVGAALARDLSGLEYLLGIAEGRIPGPPVAALLGMSVRSVERGRVAFGLDIGEHLYNPIGSVHGGVFCTLLDSAMGCAVHSSLGRGQAYTTLELKVNLVRALTVNTPDVTATGQVVSAGRRVATASGQITGPDGTLYAHATTTCLVFEALV